MSLNKKPKTINPDEVDPSVYYYDEVYDEMKETEATTGDDNEAKARKRSQPSKYIQGLKETADLRRTERELRKFKRYARDREEADNAGERDPDEEVFVTSAYKKKLAEMEKVEAEKKARLDREKDRMMNFMRNSNDKKHPAPVTDPPKSQKSREPQEPQKPSLHDCDTNADKSTDQEAPKKPRREKLVTLDDRRNYLKKVLAKRTVGSVFKDAVRRYRQRKALASKSLTE